MQRACGGIFKFTDCEGESNQFYITHSGASETVVIRKLLDDKGNVYGVRLDY